MCFLVSGAVGTFCVEALLHSSREAFSPFRLCSTCAVGFSLRGNSFGSFANWDFCLFSFLPFWWSGVEGGAVSGCTWYCVPGGFLPSRWISIQREGCERFWTIVCCARARSRFAGSFGSWRRGSCSVATVFFCPLRSSVISHHSSPHARRCGELWETSEDRYRVLSSRGSRSSDRGARWDKRARSRSCSLR